MCRPGGQGGCERATHLEEVIEAAIAGDLELRPDSQRRARRLGQPDALEDPREVAVEVEGPLRELARRDGRRVSARGARAQTDDEVAHGAVRRRAAAERSTRANRAVQVALQSRDARGQLQTSAEDRMSSGCSESNAINSEIARRRSGRRREHGKSGPAAMHEVQRRMGSARDQAVSFSIMKSEAIRWTVRSVP